MMKRRHTWPLVIAATLTCAACTSGPKRSFGRQYTYARRRWNPLARRGAATADWRRSSEPWIRPISAPTSPTPTGP